ncbi:MAG: hypothetical protein VX150_03445, partial [Candidatus Thermoplasmatota archaeon]|nr:hypothetical protein [Candidatus Thermoplasmatota archaeon]
MGELNVRLLQSGGVHPQTERLLPLVRALIDFPDYSHLSFYIGSNQEDRVLNRFFEHQKPETFLLYRTGSKRNCQRVESRL